MAHGTAGPRPTAERDVDVQLDRHAECWQHPLGVVAAGAGSVTLVRRSHGRPASRIALFTCAEATGET